MKTKSISILLALIFLASGLAKLASLEFELVAFERWGYPVWFMYLIGALATHVIHSEWGMLAAASLVFLMSAVRAYLGRTDVRSLITHMTKPKELSQ